MVVEELVENDSNNLEVHGNEDNYDIPEQSPKKKKKKHRIHKEKRNLGDDSSSHDIDIEPGFFSSRDALDSNTTNHRREGDRNKTKGSTAKREDDSKSKSMPQLPAGEDSLPIAIAVPELQRAYKVAATVRVEVMKGSDPTRSKDSQPESVVRRPAFISASIVKEDQHSRLGIVFRSVFGELQVKRFLSFSPLFGSPIRRGDRLVRIDENTNVSAWSAAQAASYVREAHGPLCFIFQTSSGDSKTAEAIMYKSTLQEKLGVSFRNDHGRLQIGAISTTGLLGAQTVLKEGDFVESINSIDVQHLSPSMVVAMIQTLLGPVTLRVKRTDATEVSIRDIPMLSLGTERSHTGFVQADELEEMESGFLCSRNYSEVQHRPSFVSVSLFKTERSRIGMSLQVLDDTTLLVSKITSTGLLAKTPVSEGMLLRSIGNRTCDGWGMDRATREVWLTSGKLSLLFQDPLGDPSHFAAMVYRPKPTSPFGISFKLRSGGSLEISSVSRHGLLAQSNMEEGDKVIAINKIPCESMRPNDAVAIAQRNPDSMTILVKKLSTNSIVIGRGPVSEYSYNGAVANPGTGETGNSCSSQRCFLFLLAGVMVIVAIFLITSRSQCDEEYFYQDNC